jgi:murein DD-endopeptidase MepM/ murein hydrolase activator NlpD
LADTILTVQPSVLSELDYIKPDSILRRAEVVNREVTSYQQKVRDAKLKLGYLPAVPPIDLAKVSTVGQNTLNIGLFGMRLHPKFNKLKEHTGMDFAVNIGTPVYATGDGVVSRVGTNSSGYGVQIHINHTDDMKTVYAHLSRVAVKRGQAVKRDQYIGRSGNTGQSTGPHLHYEVRVRDKDSKKYRAVDPMQFMKLILPKEVRDNLSEDIPMFEEF